jgi:hypothetical protein
VLHLLNRRVFLRGLAGGAAGVALSRRGFAQTGSAPASVPLEVTKLTDTFLLITGAPSNVLTVLGPDSVLLVNGGSAERSDELLKLVAEKSGDKPVKVLFNTCWHPQHTGSNETLGKAGAKIIAHEDTKLWLNAEFDVRWQKRTYEPNPKESLPNQTFYSGVQKMTFGSQPVEYGYMMQAHTDGDIYVYFSRGQYRRRWRRGLSGQLSNRRLVHRRLARRHDRGPKDPAKSNQCRDAHRPWKWACDVAGGPPSRERNAGHGEGSAGKADQAGVEAVGDRCGGADQGFRCEVG